MDLPLDDVPALIKALDAVRDEGARSAPDRAHPPRSPGWRDGEAQQSNADSGIYRLQLGYNPNSSSLGTSVVMLLWGMGTAAVLMQAAAAVLLSKATGAQQP